MVGEFSKNVGESQSGEYSAILLNLVYIRKRSFRSSQKYSQRLKYGKGENEQVRHPLYLM